MKKNKYTMHKDRNSQKEMDTSLKNVLFLKIVNAIDDINKLQENGNLPSTGMTYEVVLITIDGNDYVLSLCLTAKADFEEFKKHSIVKIF
jgi:hypothetical protein